MNDKILTQIKKASLDSIKNPGKSKIKLPKAKSNKHPMLIVFRHGETYDNKRKVFSGWRDAKLTKLGIKQAKDLEIKLRKIRVDLCITSVLSRSKDTARIALKGHKETKFIEDARIVERNYGELMGKSKDVLSIKNPDLAAKYRRGYDFPPPKGESLKMVEDRVFPFCEEIVKRIKTEKINIAVSAHGNSMRVMRKYFEKMTIVQELTHENPLATDFASYSIAPNSYLKTKYKANQTKRSFLHKALLRLKFANNMVKDKFKNYLKI